MRSPYLRCSNDPSGPCWHPTVAGFAMLIWIFTELAIVGYSWLQSVYFGLGALELILVLALLGIAPAFVSPWSRHPREKHCRPKCSGPP